MKTTILYAEDVIENLMYVRHLLKEKEIYVEHAPNGREAVRMFQNGPSNYKLILMDLQMPELNGCEATKSIRTMPEGKTIPILGFSDQDEDIARKQCLECGMNGFISKSSVPDIWIQVICEMIQSTY